MSAAPAPTTPPTAAGAQKESRVGRLLALVRKLIDYGKELAATLQQRGAATAAINETHAFGTGDIKLIVACITRALHRAQALEDRLVRNAARLDAGPGPAQPPRKPPTAQQPAAPRADAAGADPVHLPTPEQIAAEVRRRPIGAVLADICRDLGILQSHPLWRELKLEILRHGGSCIRLFRDMTKRLFQLPDPGWPADTPAAQPAPFSPLPVQAGTGPP